MQREASEESLRTHPSAVLRYFIRQIEDGPMAPDNDFSVLKRDCSAGAGYALVRSYPDARAKLCGQSLFPGAAALTCRSVPQGATLRAIVGRAYDALFPRKPYTMYAVGVESARVCIATGIGRPVRREIRGCGLYETAAYTRTGMYSVLHTHA